METIESGIIDQKKYPIVTMFNILTLLPLYVIFIIMEVFKYIFKTVTKAKIIIKIIAVVIGYRFMAGIITIAPAPLEFFMATPNRALACEMLEIAVDATPLVFIINYIAVLIFYACAYLAIPMLVGEYVYSVFMNMAGTEIEKEKFTEYSYLIDWNEIEKFFNDKFAKINANAVAAYEADRNRYISKSIIHVVIMIVGIVALFGICYMLTIGKNGLYDYFYGPVSL